MDLRDSVNNYAYNFNLSTLAVTPLSVVATSASMTAVGNGWYRIQITAPNATSGTLMYSYFYVTTPTNAFYIWGAQLELGSVASAYTPTTTVAVTTTNNINVPSGQVLVSDKIGIGTTSPNKSLTVIGSGYAKIALSSADSATAPTTLTAANTYLGLGGGEYGGNSYRAIGFGYLALSGGVNYPAYIAYKETLSSGFNGGQLSFFTRGVVTDTAPLERFTIDKDGNSIFNTNAYLNGEAANTLAQRNSTNAQTFRLYGTYTDSSNYERLQLDYNAINTGFYTISSQNAGTGSAKPLAINSANSTYGIYFQVAGTGYWKILPSGFIPVSDASVDLGATTSKVRNAYFSGVVNTGQISTTGYTVATLPTGVVGMRAYVTDALAPIYLGTLTGGGAIKCPVFYNGTAWVSA